MKDYGIAIFHNEEGKRVVYRLCDPQACDLETDVKNFKPREFVEITVEDHDGSGNMFRYIAGGDPVDMTIDVGP